MQSVTLISENREESLTIALTGRESNDGSQRWLVSVVQEAFRGAVSVWVDDLALNSFFEQLKECERLRRGEAQIQAMSPDQFALRVFNTRSKGDFALTSTIAELKLCFAARLQGGFDFDPSLLPKIVSDFETLLSQS